MGRQGDAQALTAHEVVLKLISLKAKCLVRSLAQPPEKAWEVLGTPSVSFSVSKVASAVAMGELVLAREGTIAYVNPDVRAWVRAVQMQKALQRLVSHNRRYNQRRPLPARMQRVFRRAAKSDSITLSLKRELDLAESLVRRGLFERIEAGVYALTSEGRALADRVILV